MPTVAIPIYSSARVGFIGGGFMSVVHARAARAAGARLVGVASRTAAGSERAQRALGTEAAYPSWRALLEDDGVDVVHICTPNHSHAEIATAALSAGKHVVCEKPLATSLEDARTLLDLAADHPSLVTAIPFVYRFHAMVREARARVLSGQTGRLFGLQGAYLQDWLVEPTDDDWRADPSLGGPSRAFADIGSHLSDLVQFVTNDPIARLSATMRTVHADRPVNKAITSEDVVVLTVQTRSGVIGTLHVSQVARGHKNRLSLEINGARESLGFDGETPDVLRIGTAEGFLARTRAGDISAAAAVYSILPPGHPQGYQDAFNAFVADVYATVGGQTREGLPSFDDGFRAAVVTAAVLRSHAEQAWVEVETAVTTTPPIPPQSQD